MKETIQRLQAELRARDQLIASLLDRIAVLEKNSSTSSKPPSSDIVKPPQPDPKDTTGKKTKRKKGAQPGHKQNLRKPLAPERIDEIVPLDLVQGETKITRQIELVAKPFFATEYQQLMYWCRHCPCWHDRKLPGEVPITGHVKTVRRNTLKIEVLCRFGSVNGQTGSRKCRRSTLFCCFLVPSFFRNGPVFYSDFKNSRNRSNASLILSME